MEEGPDLRPGFLLCAANDVIVVMTLLNESHWGKNRWINKAKLHVDGASLLFGYCVAATTSLAEY